MFFGENRSNGCVVQVSDEFSTGIEVLFNYLVICIVCSKLFQLEGEVLEYVFLVIFRLLVSFKLDSYDVYAPS